MEATLPLIDVVCMRFWRISRTLLRLLASRRRKCSATVTLFLAHALDTVATVGDDVSQAFHAIVTVPKNAPTATLNFKSANATSVRVANVIVVKVA